MAAARHSITALLTILAALQTIPALAETSNTPQCLAALDDADRLMRGVEVRQMQFTAYDPTQNCRLLRDNLNDVISARGRFDHCLTGDERARNVEQLDAMIERIRAQLIGNCRR